VFELKCLNCGETITYTQGEKDEYERKQVDEKGDKIDVIRWNDETGYVVECTCGNKIEEEW
jgi:hypothetical protein